MCEVADIIEKPTYYKITPSSSAETNKVLVVRFGKDKKEMRLDVISNSNFSPNEFKAYIEKLTKDVMRPITHGQILQTIEMLEQIKNYTYKGEEVDQIVGKTI